MDLFNSDPYPNLLPHEGVTRYFGRVMDAEKAGHYFERLFNTLDWRQDEVVIAGKRMITKRKVAWYGEKPFAYTYSQVTKYALSWTPEMKELKEMAETVTGFTYNSCLVNLYHNGDEGVTWHSDAEKSLGPEPRIASISLGAERKFVLKHKVTKERVEVFLENGSVLVMAGLSQAKWVHSLPKTKKVIRPRISLTFRTIVL